MRSNHPGAVDSIAANLRAYEACVTEETIMTKNGVSKEGHIDEEKT